MRVVVSLAVVALAGCTSYETAARETFSKDKFCPIERVTAKERTDISIYDRTFGKSKPPTDVAKDPERLALWKKKEDESKRIWDNSGVVFEVRGCDAKQLYKCSRGGKSGRTSCSTLKNDDET
jgi:hypothetical protein